MSVDETKSTYNILASSDDATVVSEYIPSASKSDQYQSEADLEDEFIALLERQGYDYLQIHQESDLILNLRRQLEKLNAITFTDNEWDEFFHNVLANPNNGIVEKTRMIQQDNVQVLRRDDGTSKNITLIDKKQIHNNYLQVINQYVNDAGNYNNRYDVTILVNGFPMVHSELKRRGVAIREAFNQIDRYQRIVSGQHPGCMSMCRFSLSATVRTRNITAIRPVRAVSKKLRHVVPVRRQVTALNLHLIGLLQIISQSWI